jgi:NhaA family Na+:H+ antiporter
MSTPALPPPPETWAPAHRAARRVLAPIQRFLSVEAASGIVLIIAAVLALIWANSPWRGDYDALWHTPIGLRVGSWELERTLHFWVNEGLMTIFFFVVGLEIRREIHGGELSDLRRASLPLAAALGGMVVPAVIYAALNQGRESSAGWGIPMATDIAFAVGVLTLLAARASPALRVLLLALAVIDDIGAILVIAVFYSAGIEAIGFALVAGGLVGVLAMQALAIRSPWLYLAPGAVIWAGMYQAGVHPTLAGVLLGLLTPARSWLGTEGFADTTRRNVATIESDNEHHAVMAGLDEIGRARREAVSPVEFVLHGLHPWVAFGIMPLFALANAGVELGGAQLSGDGLWCFIGIVAGLVIGKPLGITAAALLSARAGITVLPSTASKRGVLLVGCVGGIGFTMSLFIAQLAFPSGPLLSTAKLAILVASAAAAVIGLVLGATMPRPAPGIGAADEAAAERSTEH